MSDFKIIEDGDFSKAQEAGPIFFDTALLTNNLRYIARQDFVQNFDSFFPLPYGSPHPVLNGYVLCKETAMEHIGGGVARWTRIYAVKPVPWDDFRTMTYNFIGYGDETVDNATPLRARFQKNVLSRIRHEYFLVGAGLQYASVRAVPVLDEQTYYLSDANYYVDFLNNTGDFATVPTLTAYKAWVAGGSTGASGALAGEIIAEDSAIEQWFGPIYERTVRYVIAR